MAVPAVVNGPAAVGSAGPEKAVTAGSWPGAGTGAAVLFSATAGVEGATLESESSASGPEKALTGGAFALSDRSSDRGAAGSGAAERSQSTRVQPLSAISRLQGGKMVSE